MLAIDRNHMDEDLRSLGYDILRYEEIARINFLCVYIKHFFRPDDSLEKVNLTLNKLLAVYDMPTTYFVDQKTIKNLASLIKKYNLDNIDRLSAEYAPLLIADKKSFENGVTEMNPLVQASLLYHIFVNFEMDDLNPDNFSIAFEKTKALYSGRLFGLTEEKLKLIASSVFRYKMTSASTRRDPLVEEVKRIYEKKFVGKESLLESILIAKKADGYITKPQHQLADAVESRLAAYEKKHNVKLNPEDKRYMKIVQGVRIESGKTEEDLLYIQGAYSLKDKPGTTIVTSLFYDKERNDYAFEKEILSRLFMDIVYPEDIVLIVNPCPQLVEEYENNRQSKHFSEIYYLVNDESIASLYNNQFNCRRFFSYENGLEEKIRVDKVMVIARDYPFENICSLFGFSKRLQEGAEIVAFLYNTAFEASWELLGAECQLYRIMRIDTRAVATTPKEKCIFWYKKNSTQNDNKKVDILLNDFSMLKSDEKNLFSTQKKNHVCNSESFFERDTSLRKYLDHHLNPKVIRTITKVENPSREYSFSKEIRLNYILMENRKNRYAAKAYYRSIKVEKRSKYGKRLTEYVEKGLRSETVEGVLKSIERLIFDETFYLIIFEDLKENLIEGHEHNLTLKTIWFFLHEKLSAKSGYNEKLALDLFCGENQTVSNLLVKDATKKDYQSSIDEAYFDKTEAEKEKYFRLISLILDIAVDNKLADINLAKEILQDQRDKVLEEQKNARNKLLKRVLTNVEIRRMLNYVFEKVPGPNGILVFRYEKESVVLGATIRIFTGMATRELCGLIWEDFQKNTDLQFDSIFISRFLDENGELGTHVEEEDWYKFRCIPVSNFLGKMIQGRKLYLKNTYGLTSEDIKKHPVMLKDEKQLENTNNIIPDPCPQYKAADWFRKVLDSAGIADKEIQFPDIGKERVTNLSKNQNLYYSNFRHKALHEAGMTEGETNYVLGITPPTTFAKNYCDYRNPMIQYRIYVKLNRWTNQYMCFFEEDKTEKLMSDIIVSGRLKTNNMCDKAAVLDLILDKDENPESIFVTNEHGFDISVSIYGEKE